MNNIEHLKKISLDGGLLCLDFINTISDYTEDEPVNYITNEEEWLTWLKRVKLIDGDFCGFEKDSFSIDKILSVRETLYKLFASYVREEVIEKKILSQFNKDFSWMNKHLKFISQGNEITEILDYNKLSANDYLLPIIQSAKDLLVSKDLKHVKECPNCGWIFLDKTKSNTRRWCNMKACGNKIKTQKYYRKVSRSHNEDKV